jgi:hypothetical protein
MTPKTAAQHIAAAERALERAEQPSTSRSISAHYLRVAEVHAHLAGVVQAESRQARDRD